MAKSDLVASLVDRFLTWPVPESACADFCATQHGRTGRTGTNFFSAAEARQMIEYLLEAVKPIDAPAEPAADWGIIEIMGHRQHAGMIQEVERFGAKFVRVDIPGDPVGHGAEIFATHFYSGPAIFSITPCDEATARRIAARDRPRPAA